MELPYLMMKKLQSFNKYFCSIDKNLSLPENPSIKEPTAELFTDPEKLALEKI